MKTQEEIEKMILFKQQELNSFIDDPDHENNQYYYEGWIEALQWTLKHMSIAEFLIYYGLQLVKVNTDDAETGDFRLLETEFDRVTEYEKQGYTVFSIFEQYENKGEIVLQTYASPKNPYLTGYFIVKKE